MKSVAVYLIMGISHPHPRVRHRVKALVRLAQGITQTQAAQEFGAYLNSLRVRFILLGALSQDLFQECGAILKG